MYSLLQCGQAKSQIEAVFISTDKGGEIFLLFSKFLDLRILKHLPIISIILFFS